MYIKKYTFFCYNFYMKRIFNKNNLFFYIIMFIFSLSIIIFTFNNYWLYKNPVLKITEVSKDVSRIGENNEIYYIEKVTGIIQNGEHKGKILSTENYSTTSKVYDDTLYVGSDLIVELNNDGTNILSIVNIKRDKFIVTLLILFINLILIVGKTQGFKTLLSLIINIIISIFAIFIYRKNFDKINILLLFLPISIFFIIFSLYCTNGHSKKTFAAIISAIISLLISFTLAYILIEIYNDSIPFWFMDYAEAISDYKNLYFVNILLCGLGAIMDIAITLSSSLNELIEKNSKISKSSLIKSGKEIAKDIVGSMINVMFFTIYVGVIPLTLLAVRNNMPISVIINNYGQIELIRILTSCISIVLAIPISLYISVFILKERND